MFAAVAIGTLVMLRCTVFFAPQLVFDVDPVIDPSPIVGFGPAQSMAIDAMIWLFSALGLFAEVRSGRRVDLLMLLLALGGLPIVIWHGYNDLGNLWLGVSWSAAIIAALTVAHLARDRNMRVLLVALVAAALTAMLVRGVSQMLYEHARTVADYHAEREAFLAAQGWAPDSVHAHMYERRLEQNQPIGWFTTTNILGTFAAAALSMWLALAIGLWRHFGWRGAALLIVSLLGLAAVATGELYMTGSKGALLAGAIGAAIVIAAQVIVALRKRWQVNERSARRLHVVGGTAFVALIVLGVGAIIARGTLLPESAFGEKSLLFRWFYMQGSVNMLAEHYLPGVGPDNFQEAFLLHRPPRCPEEVTSAHNVLLDWAVTLGVLGWTWIAMLFIMAARAGARLLTENDTPPPPYDSQMAPSHTTRAALVIVSTSVLLALGGSFIVEARAIDALPLELWRGAGIIASLLAALLTMRAAAFVAPAALSIALGAAAGVVLVHSQIEMTLTQPGSAALALMLVALAAPASPGSRRTIALLVSLLLVLLAGWLSVRGITPAWRQQQLMIEAARELEPIARAARPTPAQIVQARTQASSTLRQAFDVLPTNPDPPLAAARQLLLAAEYESGARRSARLREAMGLAALSLDTVSLPSYHALMANLNRALARTTGEASAWLDAMSHARELTKLDPNGLSAWKLLGDICYEWDRSDCATDAYEHVLQINANMELDELKQLPERERAEIERRLRELRGGGAG
jgi:hypothetical protein